MRRLVLILLLAGCTSGDRQRCEAAGGVLVVTRDADLCLKREVIIDLGGKS